MSRILRSFVSAALLATTLDACRGCEPTPSTNDAPVIASSQKPLPVGMLGPGTSASRTIAERLAVTQGEHDGDGFELQAVDASQTTTPPRWSPASRYVRPDAMAVLNVAFARSVKSFDPLGSTRIPREDLPRVRAELDALRSEWTTTRALSDAQREWSTRAPFVGELTTDADWTAARTAFAGSLDALIAFVRETEGADKALWILPPR